MSSSIEDRIVNMQFNNAKFEKGIGETLKSLATLEKAIQKTGTNGSGLADIEKQAGKFSLGNVATAVEGVNGKFIALATIGITALTRITNAAIDAGGKIAKALTIAPVLDGFAEYELKMGSIQTIMAGTGESLETVNGYLNELNAYSDRTIYSFSDMTSNIGKFTNAGVSLERSVAAIQGVANVAALAGANSQQASNAMYNFSQALATGEVKLIDWKSIEIAGLATVQFKDQLLEGAVAAGTLSKVAEGMYETIDGVPVDNMKNFNTTLQEGWLNAEVLTDTLGKYSDEETELGRKAAAAAQDVKTLSQAIDTIKEAAGSGWAQSMEIVFGDFEEGKALWTEFEAAVSSVTGKSAEMRNQVLSDWKELGGRTLLLEGVRDGVRNIAAAIEPVQKAFRDIFPRKTGQDLYNMTERFANFMAALKPGETTITNIGRIFKGFFNIIDVGWEIFKFALGAVKDFIQEITGIGKGGALAGLAEVGDVLAAVSAEDVIKRIQNLGSEVKKAFRKIGDTASNIVGDIREVFDVIWEFIENIGLKKPDFDFSFLDSITNVDLSFFERIKDIKSPVSIQDLRDNLDKVAAAFGRLVEGWEKIKGGWDKVKGTFSDIKSDIAKVGDGIVDGVSTATEDGNWDKLKDVINIGLLTAITGAFVKLIKDGISLDLSGGVLGQLSGVFGELGDTLKAFQLKLKAEALQKIATAIAILVASLALLSIIDADALNKALTAMAVGFTQLIGAFAIIQKVALGPSTALQFIALAGGLTLLAGASLLLAISARILSGLDWEELATGLTGLVGILGSLVLVAKGLAGQTGTLFSAGAGMMAIGAALILLSISMKIFATMNWEEMVKGFVGAIGGLTGIALAMQRMPRDLAARSAGIATIAFSLSLLAIAMKLMATLSWEDIAKGLVTTGLGLYAMGAAFRGFPEDLDKIGVTLILVGVAMLFLAKSLEKMAQLSWTDLAKGLVGITVSLKVIGAATKNLGKSVKGGIGLILLVTGLKKLADVIQVFSKLSIGTLVRGLLSMSVVIGTLAGVAYLIAPAIPLLTSLGFAFGAIGLGVAGLGLGLSLAVGALATMAKIGPGAGDVLLEALQALGAALPALISGFVKGFIMAIDEILNLAPVLVKKGAKLITILLEALADMLPSFGEFAKELIKMIATVIIDSTPVVVEAGLALLEGFLQGVEGRISLFVEYGLKIIGGILQGLADGIPTLVDGLVAVIETTLTSVAEATGKLAPTLMFGVGIAFVTGFWDGIKNQASKLKDFVVGFIKDVIDWVKSGFGIASPSKVMKEIGGFIIDGLYEGVKFAAKALFTWFVKLPAEVLLKIGNVTRKLYTKGLNFIAGLYLGVLEKYKDVAKWFARLGLAIFEKIGDVGRRLYIKGRDFIKGLLEGVTEKFNDVKSWISQIPRKVKDAIGDVSRTLWTIGFNLMVGFKNGLIEKWNDVKNWVSDKVSDVKSIFTKGLDIFSPSKFTTYIGEMVGQGLANGLENSSDKSVNKSQLMVENVKDSINEGMRRLAEDLENSTDFNPTIKPVLDLSDISKGARDIGKMVPDGSGYSYSQASLISSSPSGGAINEDLVGTAAGVKFEQNNYSPKALSAADIYKKTRNQLAIAKEELGIS